MATRTRDTAPPGKEKRGTSPSPSPKKSTTNTSKTTSPFRKQADPTTTLNNNIPSYLKPTITQSKKSASSSDLHNIQNNNNNKSSLLTRRRSFDNKPPLPSSSPKTRISPNPRERIPRSSSSLSSKTSTSQKPLLDKFSKTSKDAIGKQRSSGLNSRPVTKKKTITTTTTIRKHDSTNGSTTKASIITNSQGGEQSEPKEVHQELTIHETDTIISDSEMAPDSDIGDNDSAMDDHEELNENVNNAELDDVSPVAESSSIVEQNQEITTEEPEEKVQVEEPEVIRNEPNKHDSTEKEKEEMVINTSSEENQELKKEDEGNETPMVEETEAVKEEELCQNPKQVEVDIEETEAVPEKKWTVASTKTQHQVVQSKNKESVVSNNVIEETASKLREQRKNKVRALAGAFETVISLQEPK